MKESSSNIILFRMSSSVLRLQFFTVLIFSAGCLSLLGIYHSVASSYGLSWISWTLPTTCQETRIVTKFVKQHQYMNMSSEYDYLWDELLTPTGGLVDAGEGEAGTYGISMFHQLHCLQMIRNAFQDLQSPTRRQRPAHHHHVKPNDEDEAHPPELHWTHCLDYLRQVGSTNPSTTKILLCQRFLTYS